MSTSGEDLVLLQVFNTPAGDGCPAPWRNEPSHGTHVAVAFDHRPLLLDDPGTAPAAATWLHEIFSWALANDPSAVRPDSRRTLSASVTVATASTELGSQTRSLCRAGDWARNWVRSQTLPDLRSKDELWWSGWEATADPSTWIAPVNIAGGRLTTTRLCLSPIRIWAATSVYALEGARGSLSELFVTDGSTGELGGAALVGAVNARQRRRVIEAIELESAAPPPSDAPTAVSVERLHTIALQAERLVSQMAIDGVNATAAYRRLEQWTGPCDLIEDDLLFQTARSATAQGVADRARLAAIAAERKLHHSDAVAQKESTRNNTLATLGLTIVVGAAAFAQLASEVPMRVAIGILTATLLMSIGYQVTFGHHGSPAWRTLFAVAALAGTIAASIVAQASTRAGAGWITTVGLFGNVLSLAGYWRLCPRSMVDAQSTRAGDGP